VSARERARDHLAAIAVAPRPAGGAAEATARAYCARILADGGFDVREEPFEYSAFPGRYATPVGGLASTSLLVGAAVLAATDRAGAAALLLGVGLLALISGGFWLARRGVVSLPLMRRHGINLRATRGSPSPRVWLVAHLDSKSQPIAILVRAAAIAMHAIAWAVAIALLGAEWLVAPVSGAWASVGVAAVATGLPIAATLVGDRSAGAIDNASGVAAVLAAATLLPRDRALGVLITSAEELGLAGARAWARTTTPAAALNCDGVDDDGDFICMFSGRRPDLLLALFADAGAAEGRQVGARRLLPGILVDGVAFADAGWEAVTLSRGTARTLARIHTPRDTLEMLRGSGADDAASILARVADRISDRRP
jgi:hypothetical protein